MKKLLLAFVLLMPSVALAQSNPGLVQGQVPIARQWNSYFGAKVDVVGGNGSAGDVLATGATTARTLAAQAADRINVANFGAALNGTINDSAAFNAARIAAGSYTPIFVPPGGFNVPTTPTGGTSNPLLWELSGNSYGTSTTNPVLSLGNSDSVQTFFSGTWFLGRENSPADANPVMRLDLNQTGAGGTPGDVVQALGVQATQGPGSNTGIWALAVYLTDNAANNGSDSPIPVGFQSTIVKNASSAADGMQINLQDTQNADTATAGGMAGMEIGFNATGTDSADSRRLLDLIFAPNGTNPAGVVGTGIYLRGLNGETVTRGLRMSGNVTTGIDLTGATLGSYAYNDGHLTIGTSGNLTTSGPVSLTGVGNALNVTNGATIGTILNLPGVGTALSVTNDATIGALLSLPGIGTALSVTNNATIGGLLSLTGAGTALSITNNATVGGTLTAATLTVTSLPTSAPAAHCALWNNAGVINITTCP